MYMFLVKFIGPDDWFYSLIGDKILYVVEDSNVILVGPSPVIYTRGQHNHTNHKTKKLLMGWLGHMTFAVLNLLLILCDMDSSCKRNN